MTTSRQTAPLIVAATAAILPLFFFLPGPVGRLNPAGWPVWVMALHSIPAYLGMIAAGIAAVRSEPPARTAANALLTLVITVYFTFLMSFGLNFIPGCGLFDLQLTLLALLGTLLTALVMAGLSIRPPLRPVRYPALLIVPAMAVQGWVYIDLVTAIWATI